MRLLPHKTLVLLLLLLAASEAHSQSERKCDKLQAKGSKQARQDAENGKLAYVNFNSHQELPEDEPEGRYWMHIQEAPPEFGLEYVWLWPGKKRELCHNLGYKREMDRLLKEARGPDILKKIRAKADSIYIGDYSKDFYYGSVDIPASTRRGTPLPSEIDELNELFSHEFEKACNYECGFYFDSRPWTANYQPFEFNFTVSKEGKPEKITLRNFQMTKGITEGEWEELSSFLEGILQKWAPFKPAKIKGQPVNSIFIVTIGLQRM